MTPETNENVFIKKVDWRSYDESKFSEHMFFGILYLNLINVLRIKTM